MPNRRARPIDVPCLYSEAKPGERCRIVSPQAKPALPPEVREALTYCEEVFRSHSINTPNHEEIEDRALALIRAALAPRGGAE